MAGRRGHAGLLMTGGGSGSTPLTFIGATDGATHASVATGDLVLLFLLNTSGLPITPTGWTLHYSNTDSNGYWMGVYSSLYDAGDAVANSTNFPAALGYFFTLVYRRSAPLAVLQIGTLAQVGGGTAALAVTALASATAAGSALVAWTSTRDPAATQSSGESMTSRFAQGYTYFHAAAWEQTGVQSGARNYTRSGTSLNYFGVLLEIG